MRRDTAPRVPELVTLGKPDTSALDAARAIVSYARARIAPQSIAPNRPFGA